MQNKSSKIEVLAVLVNYGDEQINFLNQVVQSLKTFEKYRVKVVVNSNIPLDIDEIDQVNVFQLNDYQLLPLTCRETIWKNRDNFELFIYGENDHLFLEKHLDKHIEYSDLLPKGKIPGLMQFEENDLGKYYPAYHLDFDWDYKSVFTIKNKVFAHFNNVHQATFILTKSQLDDLGKKFDFTKLVDDRKLTLLKRTKRKIKKRLGFELNRLNKYSVKCKVNTDVYLYGGKQKVICISEFQDNLIHHLPNIYIDGDKGRKKLRSSHERMNNAIEKMMKAK